MSKLLIITGLLLLVLAAPAMAAEEEGGGMISINPTLLLYQIALFSIFVFLIYKLLYKRLGEFMRKRSDSIASDLEEARKSRADAESYREEYRKRITHIEAEIEQLRHQGTVKAAVERERLIDAARSEAEDILAKAKHEIETTRDEAMRLIRGQIADIVVEVTEKILEGTVSPEREKELAELFLAQAGEKWKK